MAEDVKVKLSPADIEIIEGFLSDRFNMSYKMIYSKYGFSNEKDPHKLSTYLRRMGVNCPDMRELNTRERRERNEGPHRRGRRKSVREPVHSENDAFTND